MIICNLGNNFDYELEKLSRLFLPFERIDVKSSLTVDKRYAVTKTEYSDIGCNIYAFLSLDGKEKECKSFLSKDTENFEKRCELLLAANLFECFVDIVSYKPEWGILTGVRPARLFIETVKNMGYDNAVKYFSDVLKVSKNKISLLSETAKSEGSIISLSKNNSFSLYVSIPFCPTRCSYCSFVSNSIDKAIKIIPSYIEYLCKEIEFVSKIVKEKKLRLETVYIGGGTPTTLSPEDLETVIGKIKSSFDFSTCREFTVEAGRPDTITKEKLVALKKSGVSRISINPQTLNDNVLSVIGRRHTSKQFFESFKLARDLGFDNINTDLIAGLPSDTYDSFCKTIDEIIKISPENVTVHSLSMKRASTLTAVGFSPEIDAGVLSTKMARYARTSLTKAGIFPYYMYRQSKTVGNLENVGYSKKGFEGLYNVFIMDETHSIIACGASAATKLRNPIDGKIERIFNFKYPFEYLSRFDEQIERKKGIYEFYSFL
ncbi:MAG: coproporphyrinogen dehydrogenase HemZ [Clostridia bacterium]|nr:coproporphyrinogen dehydrogenase HemZ [Clostridia bacterium]